MAKKAKSIQNIKGMPDILPAVSGHWQYLENTLAEMMRAYGYREIRMPIVEPTDLFMRSIGEVTDMVEKEIEVKTQLGSHAELEIVQRSHFARFQ